MAGPLQNVRILFVIRFFSNLIPAYVIERLYWEERGMTIQMVVYAEMIFAFTIVGLEVPSGIIADRWGRKRMIVLSALMGCGEFLVLLFASDFWHFALVVVLAAIGRSASSGAEDALLYDSLKASGRERLFERYLGRLNALDIVSIMIAALCGSFLAQRFDYALNYGISLVSMLAAFALSLLLVDPTRHGEPEAIQDRPIPLRAYLTASVRFFRDHPGVRLVVLSGIVTGAAINFVDEFWQTYLDRLGIPVLYFGLASAGIFVLRLPGNLCIHKLKTRISERRLLSIVIAALAAGFAGLACLPKFGGLAALGLVCLFAGLVEPLARGYLHHRIDDSSMRATIGSFQSLGENAALSAVGVGFGYFSSRLDIFGGFGFLALVCAAYLTYFMFASRSVE
ncbi:MFS transporter [Cohnella nanjingensis]|uniref:MFS transporter n=1 Tax=Cohnella nanjingensis TaxID=1387779 RepID=A0A7X0RVY9_9BACL|nr:MFS transporter [Cohnella nanjingensis]MBB6674684.1 MFS transporter [Cohnella nanjingensis]